MQAISIWEVELGTSWIPSEAPTTWPSLGVVLGHFEPQGLEQSTIKEF